MIHSKVKKTTFLETEKIHDRLFFFFGNTILNFKLIERYMNLASVFISLFEGEGESVSTVSFKASSVELITKLRSITEMQ